MILPPLVFPALTYMFISEKLGHERFIVDRGEEKPCLSSCKEQMHEVKLSGANAIKLFTAVIYFVIS